uniref:Uncharacterized protein n=1 Tax=viral metagenome TaxID=1070528 RepID=A0A6C0BQ01_9ZZZZ
MVFQRVKNEKRDTHVICPHENGRIFAGIVARLINHQSGRQVFYGSGRKRSQGFVKKRGERLGLEKQGQRKLEPVLRGGQFDAKPIRRRIELFLITLADSALFFSSARF